MNIQDLFPIEAEITQEMIDSADLLSCIDCIGAHALRSVLPAEFKEIIAWGFYAGSINGKLCISSDKNMVQIKEPTTALFKYIS